MTQHNSTEAVTWLAKNQRQLDQDGIEVGVSRQALEETLAHITALTAELERVRETAVAWGVERWKAEVLHRPLINRNRRPLDDAWRQVIQHFGGDDVVLIGPPHDALTRQEG